MQKIKINGRIKKILFKKKIFDWNIYQCVISYQILLAKYFQIILF